MRRPGSHSGQLFLVVAFSSSAIKLLGANARRQRDSLTAKRAGARRDEDGLILWSKGVGVESSRGVGLAPPDLRRSQAGQRLRRCPVPRRRSSSLDIAVAGGTMPWPREHGKCRKIKIKIIFKAWQTFHLDFIRVPYFTCPVQRWNHHHRDSVAHGGTVCFPLYWHCGLDKGSGKCCEPHAILETALTVALSDHLLTLTARLEGQRAAAGITSQESTEGFHPPSHHTLTLTIPLQNSINTLMQRHQRDRRPP